MSRTKELGELLRISGYQMRHQLLADNFDGREGQAVWEITFTRNGCEHTLPFHNAVVARYFPRGRPLDFHHISKPITVAQLESNRTSKPMRPTYADCMYCLLSDAQTVCNGESFEEFCGDFGYDTDSRRALAAYNGCLEARQGLDRLGADYDELNRLFEDY